MSLNRSSLYYKAKGESAENLELMREIDRYYLEHPTAGVLHMQSMLTLKSYHVNVKRVRRLMRLMHLMPIYPKPSLSKGTIPKYVHPYLFIWIERFWRTIKQEHIYLNPTKDVTELRSGIAKFMRYYNYERPHQSLELLLPARQYGTIVAGQPHQNISY